MVTKPFITLSVKIIVILAAIAGLAFCIVVLPAALTSNRVGGYFPILIGMYVTAVPFFFALFQGLRLMSSLERHEGISEKAVMSLKYIKYAAAVIAALYAIGLPYIYIVADRDDAPGVILLALFVIFVSLAVAVVSALYQRRVHQAVEASKKR